MNAQTPTAISMTANAIPMPIPAVAPMLSDPSLCSDKSVGTPVDVPEGTLVNVLARTPLVLGLDVGSDDKNPRLSEVDAGGFGLGTGGGGGGGGGPAAPVFGGGTGLTNAVVDALAASNSEEVLP